MIVGSLKRRRDGKKTSMNRISSTLENVLFKNKSNPSDSSLLSINGCKNELHKLESLGFIKIYSEDLEGNVDYLLEYDGEEYIRMYISSFETPLKLLLDEITSLKENFSEHMGFKTIKGNSQFEKWRANLKLYITNSSPNPLLQEIYEKLDSFNGWSDESLLEEINGSLSALYESSITNKGDSPMQSNKIFIVHGRNEQIRDDIELFIRRIGLDPIILCNQPNGGLTIIEKIEQYTNVDFAIVIYTACDIGKYKDDSTYNPRARQNVVFEHGYLINKLSRKNVIALVEDNVETPGDLSGVVYIALSNINWKQDIMRELNNCNIPFDWSKA